MKQLLVVLALLMSACSSREVLVVYSPHGKDILQPYEELFEAEYPEIDLQWLDMGSQQVLNRITAEEGRPTCDVWWGGPSTMFMQAADKGLLASYTPSWSDAVSATDKDPQDRWYGTHSTPLAVMFNDNYYTRETVPQTWDALLEAKWDQKITIRKPLDSGTMRTFIGAMITRAENEDAGIAWLAKLHGATENYMNNPPLLFERIKHNEEFLTVWIMPDAVLQSERHGYPFDFVVPPGTPVMTEAVAIVEGAPHREWAERFVEFVTTEEALVHQAEEYGKIPARNDVDKDLLPAWMGEQTIEPMDIDWQVFAEKTDGWYDRWESEVYNAK